MTIFLIIIGILALVGFLWICYDSYKSHLKRTYVLKSSPKGKKFYYMGECNVFWYKSKGMSTGILLATYDKMFTETLEVIPKVNFLNEYISLLDYINLK